MNVYYTLEWILFFVHNEKWKIRKKIALFILYGTYISNIN